MFTLDLVNKEYKHSTLKTALAAISFYHKKYNLTDPTKSFRLARILKGVAKSQNGKNKLRPIRLRLLEDMLKQLGNTASLYLQSLLKAIFLVTYHGCFRIGEVVLSGKNNEHYMKMENISFVYKNNVIKCLKIRLPSFKHSKHGVTIKIRTVSDSPCPVKALVDYLKVRGDSPGPVFSKEDGDLVNRVFGSFTPKKNPEGNGEKRVPLQYAQY